MYQNSKKCQDCGEVKEDVRKRTCGYYEDIFDSGKREEVCDACEEKHMEGWK